MTEDDRLSAARTEILRTPVIWFMAFAAALGTASIYPLQPAIAAVAGSLRASVADIGVALACGPIGYLLGLALLVPLVDRFAPRYVLATQFGALAVSMAVNAAVGTPLLLGLAVTVVGAGSAVGAQLSSVAGRFADLDRRATVLGIVTAGIPIGILGGRIGGGWLTDVIGWRGMLLVFPTACAAIAVAGLRVLPAAPGSSMSGYLQTLRGLPALYVRFPPLRLAAARGALWFFAFCTMWAALAVALSQPPFSYSPERIGLYALAGLLGVAATRVAGACTDRAGARTVILTGLVVAALAAAALGPFLSNTAVALICLGLFDAGLFAAQVANQSTVLGIDPGAPARFNSAYMLVYFIGGSLGTAFGATAAEWYGWRTTTAITALVVTLAALITATARTKPDRQTEVRQTARGSASQ